MLIVGADGGIGRELRESLASGGRQVVGTSRRPHAEGMVRFDLRDGAAAVRALEGSFRTAFVCAAVTNAKACEDDPAGTADANVRGTLEAIREFVASGIFVVWLSSHAVFSGARAFYQADAPVDPITEYGRQKAAVEEQLRPLMDRVAIVRMTKVMSPAMPLVREWTHALRAGRPIHPFGDVFIAPITRSFAVRALTAIGDVRRPGVYQISGAEDVSYAAVASLLARELGAGEDLVRAGSAGSASLFRGRFNSLDMSGTMRAVALAPQQPIEVASELARA